MPDPNEGVRYVRPRDDGRAPAWARFIVYFEDVRMGYTSDAAARDRMISVLGEGCTWTEIRRAG